MNRIVVPILLLISLAYIASAQESSAYVQPNLFNRYLTLDLGGGVEMKLVKIEPGSFDMGSSPSEPGRKDDEGPVHRVTISRPFYMGVHEVTQAQYKAAMGKNPSYNTAGWPDAPVERVSWKDAVDFCVRLAARTGYEVSLPSEAQWEYACRAECCDRYNFGDNKRYLYQHCNCSQEPNIDSELPAPRGDGHEKTAPVGSYMDNIWGLYDMHGNVREWCLDKYSGIYYKSSPKTDPSGSQTSRYYVIRGGAWDDSPDDCRSARRFFNSPTTTDSNLGFRVIVTVRDADPISAAPAPAPVTHNSQSQSRPEPKPQLQSETKPQSQPETKPQSQPETKPVSPAAPVPAGFDSSYECINLELGKGQTMKLVKIPAGSFMMGEKSEAKDSDGRDTPRHQVAISQPFYMGICEVTQSQYEAVIGKNPSRYKSSGKNAPVDRVNWHEANEFCQKLSARTGMKIKLPTEAQWEYACRAGTDTVYSFGDSESLLHKYANYCDKTCTDKKSWQDESHSDGFDKTAPVGSFPPNAFGLYDMHGNALEWCGDWFGDDYYKSSPDVDPTGPSAGTKRVTRGGTWANNPECCRSAKRIRSSPDARDGYAFGFRVIAEIDHPVEPEAPPAVEKPVPVIKPITQENKNRIYTTAVPDSIAAAKPGEPDFSQKEISVNLGSGVEMALVKIPSGSFMMGSPDDENDCDNDERPCHGVTISKPFYIGIYEVTQAQYKAVTGQSIFGQRDKAGMELPLNEVDDNVAMYYVSWDDAVEFCRKMSEMTGCAVSLPTEAQWEYACRAGRQTRYYFGSNKQELYRYGNYCDKSSTSGKPWQDKDHDDGVRRISSVGNYRANDFGLYDMYGNVFEWCRDYYYNKYYSNAPNADPPGPASGTERNIRGGGWISSTRSCRSANRYKENPSKRADDIGFRVIIEPVR